MKPDSLIHNYKVVNGYGMWREFKRKTYYLFCKGDNLTALHCGDCTGGPCFGTPFQGDPHFCDFGIDGGKP